MRLRVGRGPLRLVGEAVVAEDLSGSQVVCGVDGRGEAFLGTAEDLLHYERKEC